MTNDTGSAVARLIQALGDPDRLFDRDQLVFLMATAQRWGYEAAAGELAADPLSWYAGFEAGHRAAEAEFSAGYPPPPFLIVAGVQTGADQRVAREAAAADRTQRYAGGPVPAW